MLTTDLRQQVTTLTTGRNLHLVVTSCNLPLIGQILK